MKHAKRFLIEDDALAAASGLTEAWNSLTQTHTQTDTVFRKTGFQIFLYHEQPDTVSSTTKL